MPVREITQTVEFKITIYDGRLTRGDLDRLTMEIPLDKLRLDTCKADDTPIVGVLCKFREYTTVDVDYEDQWEADDEEEEDED